MTGILQKITSFISRFDFHNPEKEKIVVFDEAGSDVLIKTILYDFSYVILPARGEKFFISPQILFRTLKKIKITDLKNTKNLKYHIANCYYLSCIEYINPKIVITFVENNFAFQWVSQNYQNAEFIAIQNGRNTTPGDLLSGINGEKNQQYFSHFICFGQYDIEEYKKYGHRIINAYPAGSLKAGYFRTCTKKENTQLIYDLCLISQYRESVLEGTYGPEVKRGLDILFNFIKRFIQENEAKFCIAMCPDNPEKQSRYYQKIFGERIELIKQKPGYLFSSYEIIDSSNVSLNLDSALGYEALGYGKKVLFCNFTGDTGRDTRCADLCRINVIDYDLFSQKLKKLLLIDQDAYLEETEKDRKYLMNYNPDFPAHIVARQLIKKYL